MPGSKLGLTYDPEADAIYIKFTEMPFHEYEEIDSSRGIDVDITGKIIGLEILGVSHGIDLDGIPDEILPNVCYLLDINNFTVNK